MEKLTPIKFLEPLQSYNVQLVNKTVYSLTKQFSALPEDNHDFKLQHLYNRCLIYWLLVKKQEGEVIIHES